MKKLTFFAMFEYTPVKSFARLMKSSCLSYQKKPKGTQSAVTLEIFQYIIFEPNSYLVTIHCNATI